MNPYKAGSIDAVEYFHQQLKKNHNPYKTILETGKDCFIYTSCKRINDKVENIGISKVGFVQNTKIQIDENTMEFCTHCNMKPMKKIGSYGCI